MKEHCFFYILYYTTDTMSVSTAKRKWIIKIPRLPPTCGPHIQFYYIASITQTYEAYTGDTLYQ